MSDVATLKIISKKHGVFRVLIDAEDIPKVQAGVPWTVSVRPDGRIYVKSRTHGQLHRLLMSHCGEHVDHANHDYLDLRKSELRCASNAENMRNMRKPSHQTSSRFKGVSRDRSGWQAHIKVNGKSISLGKCPGTPAGERECADRYDHAAREHFGEFAKPNHP